MAGGEGDLFNGLGKGMKAWVAAEVAFNSNFGELSRRNGAADTENIMTLGEYMRKNEIGTRTKESKDDLAHDEKLMRTYVVPMTMPNGERIDIVVNAKGQDIAQIYVNEDPENRFHLDESVVEKIRLMTSNAIDKDSGYEREFVPKNLDELAEKISKGELIPKTQENVEERKNKVDQNRMSGKGEEEDEKTVEEVAKDLGLPPTAIEKFCEEAGINQNSLKGSAIIQNTEKLQRQIGKSLDMPIGGNLIALRVDGVDATTKLALIDLNGEIMDFNEQHDGERDESQLLEDLVPEGSNGSENADSDKSLKDTIYLETNDGEVIEVEAEINKEGNQEYFEERLKKIEEITESAINEIESDDSLDAADRANKLADLSAESYAEIEKLQNETGISAPEISEKALARANAYADKAVGAGLREDLGGALKTAGQIGIGAVAVATGASLLNNDEVDEFGRPLPPGKLTH